MPVVYWHAWLTTDTHSSAKVQYVYHKSHWCRACLSSPQLLVITYHQSALLNFTTTVKLHAGSDLRDHKDLEIFLSQLNLSVNPRMIAIIINVMEIHHPQCS